MSYAPILPVTPYLPGWIGGPFAALAHETGSVPFEIPGVARYGDLPIGAKAVAQIHPLLPLDGSPRPAELPDVPELARMHDILDTKWLDLMKGVDLSKTFIGDSSKPDRKLFLSFYSMGRDDSLREILNRLQGEPVIAINASFINEVSQQRLGEEAWPLAFFAGALMACAGDFVSEAWEVDVRDGIMLLKHRKAIMDYAVRFFRRQGMPFKHLAAGAMVAETFADAISRNFNFASEDGSFRSLAAKLWQHALNFQGEDQLSAGAAKMIEDRILNLGQWNPVSSKMGDAFRSNVSAPSLKEKIRNRIRAVWVDLLAYAEGPSVGDNYRWRVIHNDLIYVHGHLQEAFPGRSDLERGALELADNVSKLLEGE
jgi:hypothetical protein